MDGSMADQRLQLHDLGPNAERALIVPKIVQTDEAHTLSKSVALAVPYVNAWGWLPALSVVCTGGLLMIAFANTAARADAPYAESLFWPGLLILFLPVAARLASASATRRERIGLVAVLGLGLYLVKLLHSPVAFTFYDEFSHWRTADDIITSHRLFQENPLLRVSALYPGLEIVTSALVNMTGLSIFQVGIVMLGVARLVFVLALFLLYEQAGGSPRVAGIAVLLYMSNPNFVFFDAQFSYESLGLPIAVLALYATACHQRAWGRSDRMLLPAVLGCGAVVIIHHMTSYALMAFLLVWTVTTLYVTRSRRSLVFPGALAFLTLAGALVWMVLIGTAMSGYLGPILSRAMNEVLGLITGQSAGRQLFRTFTGQLPPLWERITGLGAVALVLIGLPFGLIELWKRYRQQALALALGIGVLAYPLTLALRLTRAGVETSNRASEFLFLAIGFVLSVGVTKFFLSRRVGWPGIAGFLAWAVTIFVGGVIVGWSPYDRLPGSYLVAAETRSIEPQGVTTANWMLEYLGRGNRLITDRTNQKLLGSYGAQRPVTSFYDHIGTAWPVVARSLGPGGIEILRKGTIRYIVVDRRLSNGLPRVGYYFEQSEPDQFNHMTPISPEALAKFDYIPGVRRVFDSGNLIIYDVGALSGVR
jgi:hypothetical protein